MIGDLRTAFDPCTSQTKHAFSSLDGMITFRLFSLQNLSYKWTIYKNYDSGQEEFVEDFSIDFRDEIGDQLISESQLTSHLGEKSFNVSSISKDITAQFKSTGVKLKFMFYVADDLKVIEEAISDFLQSRANTAAVEVESDAAEVVETKTGEPVQEVTSSQANIDISSKI